MLCWFGYKILQRGGGGGGDKILQCVCIGGILDPAAWGVGGEGGRIIDPAAWGGVIRSCSGGLGGFTEHNNDSGYSRLTMTGTGNRFYSSSSATPTVAVI